MVIDPATLLCSSGFNFKLIVAGSIIHLPLIIEDTLVPVRRCGSLLPYAPRAFAALLLLGANLPAAALSLGDHMVLSNLGEPLRLELGIESDQKSGGLPVARLINADGAEVSTVPGVTPGGIRMEVVAIDDVHQRLRIRSTLPVWEPLITLRVEVTQATMRVVRELPVMLDPPTAESPAEPTVAQDNEASLPIDPGAPLVAAAAQTAPSTQPPTVAERPRSSRSTAKLPEPDPAPQDSARPPPRFQLTPALSTDSLIRLQNHPEPQPRQEPVATSEEKPQTVEPDSVESAASTIDKPARRAATAARTVESPVSEEPAVASAPTRPRGSPLGPPWHIFFVMAALAVALFAYARQMRRRMQLEDELAG